MAVTLSTDHGTNGYMVVQSKVAGNSLAIGTFGTVVVGDLVVVYGAMDNTTAALPTVSANFPFDGVIYGASPVATAGGGSRGFLGYKLITNSIDAAALSGGSITVTFSASITAKVGGAFVLKGASGAITQSGSTTGTTGVGILSMDASGGRMGVRSFYSENSAAIPSGSASARIATFGGSAATNISATAVLLANTNTTVNGDSVTDGGEVHAVFEAAVIVAAPANGVVKFFDCAQGWISNSGTTRTTTFAGTAGDEVAVFAATENGIMNISGIANDGAALTWTLKQSFDSNDGNQTILYLWTTVLNTTRTVTATVTASTGGKWGCGSWVGGGSLSIGATSLAQNGVPASGSGSAPSLNLTTTQPNSQVVVFNIDWFARTGARTYRQVNGVSPVEDLYAGEVGVSYIVTGARYADVGVPGAKTFGQSIPADQRYVTAAVEFVYSNAGSVVLFTGWGIPI